MKEPITIINKKYFIEPDVLLTHKPVGMSSFGLIRKLRPIIGTKKIGHAGTLDPLAHGLMIVGVNKGTKKMAQYLKLPKTYIAEILVGVSTTTGDAEGEVVEEKIVQKDANLPYQLDEVLMSMKGLHTLSVPLYSAIKVEGKPLYAYARSGKTPPFIPQKEMNLYKIELFDAYYFDNKYVVKIRCEVSSGSYIRTFAEELGKRLGYPARLKSLYRVAIGDFYDKDAYRLPSKKKKQENIFRAILRVLSGK